jgi:hypothetical protein
MRGDIQQTEFVWGQLYLVSVEQDGLFDPFWLNGEDIQHLQSNGVGSLTHAKGKTSLVIV